GSTSKSKLPRHPRSHVWTKSQDGPNVAKIKLTNKSHESRLVHVKTWPKHDFSKAKASLGSLRTINQGHIWTIFPTWGTCPKRDSPSINSSNHKLTKV
ncbi:hypothetical protein PIB30_077864, partial [Stylosanthes scabra]|nr:hypothetical protein [Stylosanthes scabra]